MHAVFNGWGYEGDTDATEKETAKAAFVVSDHSPRPWTVAASLVRPHKRQPPRLFTDHTAGFERETWPHFSNFPLSDPWEPPTYEKNTF